MGTHTNMYGKPIQYQDEAQASANKISTLNNIKHSIYVDYINKLAVIICENKQLNIFINTFFQMINCYLITINIIKL